MPISIVIEAMTPADWEAVRAIYVEGIASGQATFEVHAPTWALWDAAHHPFTSVHDEDIDKLTTDPAHCRAKSYDLVLNGIELGSGSIRIHRRDLQTQVFAALGFSEEEAKRRFGFLLEALEYGAPPHGGIALGKIPP